jgi:hypothetical protein
MSRFRRVFTNKAGKPMEIHGGAAGMDFGIEDIPRSLDAEGALSHVFSSFAACDYSIGDIDFGKVTFKYELNGTPVGGDRGFDAFARRGSAAQTQSAKTATAHANPA